MRPIFPPLTLAALALACASPSAALAQDAPARRIVVLGEARAEAAPDRASFTAGVQAEAASAGAAMDAASSAMTAVLAALEAAGAAPADIQTQEISIDPVWDDGDGGQRQPRVRGYAASNLVAVRAPEVSRLGPLIDAASAAGANRLMGVSFDIADPGAQEAEARAKAVADARSKAEQLAAAAGVRLGPVVSIAEQGGGEGPVPLFARAEAMSAPPVSPGTVGVEVQVEVIFGIE